MRSLLDVMLRQASRVRVAEISGSGTAVVDLEPPGARDRLRAAMVVESLPGFVCMCRGDVRFEIVGPDDGVLAVVVLHHASTLRWDRWEGHAVLADGRLVLRWLEEQGISNPSRQVAEAESRRDQASEEEAAWVAAIPAALTPLTDRVLALSKIGAVPSAEWLGEAQDLLRRAVPDPVVRVLDLLAWCGSGSGRYSGFPAHEVVPGLLLKAVPIAEITVALRDPRARPEHDAGAVRHLVGWKSRSKHKRDVDSLPEPLKERLLRQAERSDDPTTLRRARRMLLKNDR
ncbi:hypothetical protein [Allokutzneria sp. NRRL B-24872]|uniref:hypothetical protein n=1 Tax=Allokutzneria sp. NRRL B-24872 TaxID=1137961 RepID=UPI000A3A1FF1|nr:hypothetical protein [Allokutzneria sp. NRRL B-24872]